MKKSLALLLVAALLLGVFALIGCNKPAGTDAQQLSVCLIVPSSFGDKSFNDSALEGAERLKEDYGIKLNTIECKNEGYKQNMMNAAEENDFVIPIGWEFSEIKSVAEEYPDTKFIWIDNVVDGIESSPNILCITYKQNEGAFLAGYIAARMSQTNAIGAVGGDDSEVINDFMTGYEQGAKYANAGINIYTNYVGDYENPQKGKFCAEKLHQKGADVIFQVAGNTGNGVFQAAKEDGFYAIGVDQDQKISASEYDDVIICSVKKEVGNSIYDTIRAFIEDETWDGGQNRVCGMDEGYISIAYGNSESKQQISEDLKNDVAALAKKIAGGTIVVESSK